jgi:hypothetical protein
MSINDIFKIDKLYHLSFYFLTKYKFYFIVNKNYEFINNIFLFILLFYLFS